MTLLEELERRERLYLKRASESDHKADAAIDPAEYQAWKRIAAAWRSLAAQAKHTTELLAERESPPRRKLGS
jgi:hypothetical protein